MNEQTKDQVRNAVREQYGSVARSTEGATGSAPSCCAPGALASLALGYSADDLAAVPEGANMGLGCGNPQAIAKLKPGETVLDLGAGGGFDCFLAAKQVGPTGRVLGVDMTPDMVSKARANAQSLGVTHVEFRLGEIEHLPVADGTVDVILSNCVINLSPDKSAVFRDAFRVLRAGGRLAISDVVALAPLPEALAGDIAALTGCISGAAEVASLREMLESSGFEQISVQINEASRDFIRHWMPNSGVEDYVASASIEAIKPGLSRDASRPSEPRQPTPERDVAACCAPSCCPTKTDA
ncbi:MAG: arsenite methyltransferase [Deltaproteobacteria bacterium]|nr:arsenite methyltransferase [Deltaproteobacteria bacterium]